MGRPSLKISRECLTCNKIFTTFPSKIKIGSGKYCSRKCVIHPNGFQKGHKSFHTKESIQKMREFNTGEKSHWWRGGRVKTTDGYILIWNPSHPFANNDKYVLEHRLVIEKQIGRYLKPEEVVHHINGVRDDNRIKNLNLFCNHSNHMKYHYPKGRNFCGQGHHSHPKCGKSWRQQ